MGRYPLKPSWRVVLAASAVVVLVVAAGVWLGVVFPHGGNPSSTTSICSECFQTQPIVDVLMPVLGNSSTPTNPNLTVNMTAGSTGTYEVDIYPTIDVNLTMAFRTVLVSSGGGGNSTDAAVPVGTFVPAGISLKANVKGTTLLTLSVPASAVQGTYSTVVSATDDSNSSNVWGVYFQLIVT